MKKKFDPLHIELALRALQEGKKIRVRFNGNEQILAMTEENVLYFPSFFQGKEGYTPLGLSDISFAGAIDLLSTAYIPDICS